MRAYFATKLSPNISETPNGFLICKNVPIARTGEQEYLGYELDLQDGRRDEVVIVTREESEVFSPETLASFEGTIFTDEHPSDEVTTQNVQYLQRGFVKDVRRGSGADADKILADIIVTDRATIGKIVDDGKREISCGYKCEYVEQDGKIYQKNIRGNHVALVDSGRAGKDVAIKDSAVKNTRKEKFFMAKKNTKRQSIFSKLMGIVTQDADPEIVGELMEELASKQDESDEEPAPAPAPEKKEEAAPVPAPEKKEESKDEDVMTLLKGIIERLDKLEAGAKGTDDDPLAELEKEVEAAAGTEAAEKPVEEMDEEEAVDDEDPNTADEEEAALDEAETSGEETADEETADEEAPETCSKDKAIKKAIRDAKKVVAGIKDPKQKKLVADSMAKIIRQSYGIRATTPKNSYAAINAVKTKKARAADSGRAINLEARQSAYDARNPHIKKK